MTRVLPMALANLLLCADLGFGQSRMRRMNERFDSADPAVGGRVPDITVYDADGAPFELRSFEGEVTVLVFGCLT